MAPDKLETGDQCCLNKFDYQVFSVCILLVSFTLGLLKNPSPTLLQVLQPRG